MVYIMEKPEATLSDLECDWLVENTTDTYAISVRVKWDAGKHNHSAEYSHSILVLRFSSEEDAMAYKLRWL